MSDTKPKTIRVARIELCDFQAFPGSEPVAFDLREKKDGPGLNLLLYGENGSGKSSLGRALRDMFDPNRVNKFDDRRHVFSFIKDEAGEQKAPGFGHVLVEFDDPTADSIAWRAGDDSYRQHALFADVARTRGWMDYRTLWKAAQIPSILDFVPFFRPLTEELLVECPYPDKSGALFGERWQNILKLAKGRPTTGNRYALDTLQGHITKFNQMLRAFLLDLEKAANAILERFTHWTTIELRLEREVVYSSKAKGQKLSHGEVSLRVRYRGKLLSNLTGFLNEARITAFALSIHLAALKLSAPRQRADGVAYPRLLILDDVLISLDMTHRRPLLDLLEQQFQGWQVFLLTHDRAWYEVAKQHLKGGWKHRELFCVQVGDEERPLSKDDHDHIDRAETFLLQGEPKAAAVHLRTAFEEMLKRFCQELKILVPFTTNHKDITLRGLWSAIEAAEWEYKPADKPELERRNGILKVISIDPVGFPVIPTPLSSRINLALSWVLNPLSHSEPVDRYRDELFDAADCLLELRIHFNRIEKAGKPRHLNLMTERDKLVRLLKHKGHL